MLDAIYPDALDCGIPADTFWDLTLQEIVDTLESHARQKENKARLDAGNMFALATIIANRVGYTFTDEKNRSEDMLLMPWHLFPDLFEAEGTAAAEGKAAAELDNYKALRRRHAAAWNKRFEGDSDGSGETVGEGHGGDVRRTEEIKEP